MTMATRPAYVQALIVSLAYRGSARSWAAMAAECEAVGQLDLYRNYAERATESEKKADGWLAEAWQAIVEDWSPKDDKEV